MRLVVTVPALIIAGFALHAATSHATGRREPLVSHGLAFHYGTSEPVDPAAADDLADWVQSLAPDTYVEVRGYTCEADHLPSTSTYDALHIAQARAQRLKDLLAERGVDPDRMTSVAYDFLPGTKCQARVVALP
jgi:uncharacterized protein (UPF0276 family)